MKIQKEHSHPPLVSVIMPLHNNDMYIENSIRSVQAQTMQDWELLIVDDSSTDNSVALVKQLADLDSRIHLICLRENYGAAIARNTALREASGKYIAFLDADDTWSADKLEKQTTFMDQNGYLFSYTAYWREDLKAQISGPKYVNRRMMEIFCWIGCSTVMYNREAIGLIQITPLRKNNDYAIWLHICKKADCYLLDEELTQYNRHEGSISYVSPWVKLRWHYILWRQERGCSPIAAIFYTLVNSVASFYKKFRYTTKKH